MRRETKNAKRKYHWLILEGLVPGLMRVDFRQFQSSIFASPLARAPFSIASLSERLDY